MKRLAAAAALFAVAVILPAPISAQTPPAKTILDRVYSDVQAGRGDAIFHAHCAKCHEGADVDGPSLEGDPFIDRWREDSLGVLFRFVKTRMPRDSPGKLSDAEYLDVLTYLLQSNDYPAGDRELTAESSAKILVVGKSGPAPLPTNSVIHVAGCLEHAGAAWVLNKATVPVRAREGEPANSPALPGIQSFRLQNLEDAEGGSASDAGKSVRVKGVLIRQSSGDRINVLSVEPIGSRCAP